MEHIENFKSLIHEKTKVIADSFLNQSLEDMIAKLGKNGLLHPESIDSGITGILFYLLEFHIYSGKIVYLKKAEDLSIELIAYCKSHKTDNFSLYRGRGGFIYFLLSLYYINKNNKLLDESIDLITDVNEEYLMSEYISDYLYDGRTGTLLLLTLLYKLSNSELIASYIIRFIEKIAENAVSETYGISWKAVNEVNIKNSVGFAFGVAGIKYAFEIVNDLVKDKKLDVFIININKFIDLNWNKELQNWSNNEIKIEEENCLESYKKQYRENANHLFIPKYDDYSWAGGKLGLLLSQKDNNYDLKIDEAYHKLVSISVFDGKAGLGLFLLDKLDQNSSYYSYLIHIIQELINVKDDGDIYSIMHGELGVTYFLLKTISPDKRDFIMAPLKDLIAEAPDIKNEEGLVIDFSVLLKGFYRKLFPHTMNLLEYNQDILIGYWKKMNDNVEDSFLVQFLNFMDDLLISKREAPGYKLLDDIFGHERSKLEIINNKKSSFEIYLNQLCIQDDVVDILNKPDEYLFNIKFKISDQLIINRTKWDWSNNADYLKNLLSVPAYFEYLLLPSYNESIYEYPLKIDGLVLHRFDEPRSIYDALTEIKYFCQTQPVDVVKEYSRYTGSIDVDDFINRLDFLIVHKVKHLIFKGILVVAEE